MHVVGRNGTTLEQAWSPRPEAYLSISIPDFPNFFMLNGPNGPVGNFSLIEVAEIQFRYVMQLIERIRAGACREVCATRDALTEFERARELAAQRTVWVTGCRSWYLDDRGLPAVWPWSWGCCFAIRDLSARRRTPQIGLAFYLRRRRGLPAPFRQGAHSLE